MAAKIENVPRPLKDEFVFSKDEVFVYPSKEQALPGNLSIIKQGSDIFISWQPRAKDAHTRSVCQLYAMRVNTAELRSLKRYIPTIGVSHLILISKEGLAFPPFFFHAGGVREFMGALRMYTTLVGSDEEPNLYHIRAYSDDPTSHDRLRSSLEAMEKSLNYSPAKKAASPPPVVRMTEGTTKPARQPPKQEDGFFGLLENFSKVTQFARSATQQLSGSNDTLKKTTASPKANPPTFTTRLSEINF